MVLRVIKEKTNIVIPEEDIIACHRVGKKETILLLLDSTIESQGLPGRY